jgi:triosephosphate isomerase
LQHLDSFLQFQSESLQCFVFPPLTAIDAFYNKRVKVGVQNAYPVESGAVTGEVGVEQLREFGVDSIIIGHSERREILGETQAAIAKKYEFFKSKGFTIVYCFGEPLEVRQAGDLQEYLLGQFEGIDTSYENLIVAYEPIWAIGTGVSADSETIQQTHMMVKKMIDNKPLLYGGSVKPESASEILTLEGVDGVLVGSASLDVESFQQIIANSLV